MQASIHGHNKNFGSVTLQLNKKGLAFSQSFFYLLVELRGIEP